MMLKKKKYNMLLDSIKVQKAVLEAAERCAADVTAINGDGSYAVDAKSVLGFFSLDLKKPITIETKTETDSNIIENALRSGNIKYKVA